MLERNLERADVVNWVKDQHSSCHTLPTACCVYGDNFGLALIGQALNKHSSLGKAVYNNVPLPCRTECV